MKNKWAYIGIGASGLLLLSSYSKKAAFRTLTHNATKNAFGQLDNTQKNSLNSIIDAFNKYGDGDGSKLAYIIATAWHESRLKPVRECFANSDYEARLCVSDKNYGVSVNGNVYYGRGFVQLTWYNNYKKMSDIININLVDNPDLALQTKYSSKILVIGMYEGLFAKRDNGIPYKLSDFIDPALSQNDFFNARRIVNGLDRAGLINDYAISIVNYDK